MVSAGDFHTILLRTDGKVSYSGNSDVLEDYNLVAATKNACGHTKCKTCGKSTKYKQVTAGGNHALLLSECGKIVTLGRKAEDQCHFPALEKGDGKIVQVSAGQKHSVALTSSGKVIHAGKGVKPVIAPPAGGSASSGGSESEEQTQWEMLKQAETKANAAAAAGRRCVQVSAGYSHTALLYSDGTVDACGYNKSGQCQLPKDAGYKQVSAGGAHTVLLHDNGQVEAFGSNQYGQCDVGSLDGRYTRVSAGRRHTVLLREDGMVNAVGCNEEGQCNVPEPEHGITYLQASAGGHQTTLLRSDGQAVTVGAQGDIGIPEVLKFQSMWSYLMTAATLPEDVAYTPDTEELPVN